MREGSALLYWKKHEKNITPYLLEEMWKGDTPQLPEK